ncbi:MAG: hypothetical protein AAGE52_09260 [Myxococcota bacterium]
MIEGVAGTGKTTFAAAQVDRWLHEGRGVLVLSATERLAGWWATRAPEALCRSIPSLARLVLRRTGAPPELDEDWDGLVREAADHVLAGGDGWDAVVVDGASDVSDAGWELAERAATGGVLWACVDPLRRFWPDRAVPRSWFDEVHSLETVYRSPALLETAQRFLADAPGEDALPDSLHLAPDRTPEEVVQNLDDAVVLSLRGQRDARGLVHHWRDERIPAETFLRFSGLEAPTVVIGDVDLVDDRLDDRLYLAITRATTTAIVCGPRGFFEHNEVLYGGLS